MRPIIPFCISLSLLTAGSAIAADTPFLFDALRNKAYRQSWDGLMAKVKMASSVPEWLEQFSKTYDGVASQAVSLTIEGKSYELFFVCKPTDCAGHRFDVLFETASKRAFGALGGKDSPPGFFGDPAPALQEALAKATKG